MNVTKIGNFNWNKHIPCNGSNDYKSYLGQMSKDKFLQVWIISIELKLKQDDIQVYFFCSIYLTTFCYTSEYLCLGYRRTFFWKRWCFFPSSLVWLLSFTIFSISIFVFIFIHQGWKATRKYVFSRDLAIIDLSNSFSAKSYKVCIFNKPLFTIFKGRLKTTAWKLCG